jgi:hypothetical protein
VNFHENCRLVTWHKIMKHMVSHFQCLAVNSEHLTISHGSLDSPDCLRATQALWHINQGEVDYNPHGEDN